MNYMETVIIITEMKLTTTVNDNIHELYGPLMCQRESTSIRSKPPLTAHGSTWKIGRFRLGRFHISPDTQPAMYVHNKKLIARHSVGQF